MSESPIHTPKSAVNFICAACKTKFEENPDRHEDAPDRPWHPFSYFAQCPRCGDEAGQAWWQINIWKGHANATGPTSAEGIAVVTSNIAGHPTPQEALITRFNAMTHGNDAKVARYFPARPGKYEICDGCEYLEDVCENQKGCLKRAEINLRYQIAFSTQDPHALMDLNADMHAAVRSLLDEMIYIVAKDGVRLTAPKMYYDKDGACHIFKYSDKDTGEDVIINEHTEHPLLKRIFEAIAKIGMSMSDMNMTPKGQDETSIIKGHLAKESDDQETMADFQQRQTSALEKLAGMIESSKLQTEQDEILAEYQLEDDGHG